MDRLVIGVIVGAGAVSYKPLYLQVKDILLKRVVDGLYRPGNSIPSESQLAADFGTSISTIRQAVSILVSEGYLVKKQGKGTFVAAKPVPVDEVVRATKLRNLVSEFLAKAAEFGFTPEEVHAETALRLPPGPRRER